MNRLLDLFIPSGIYDRRGANREQIKEWLPVLGGLGLGAGLMYMFDPDRGRRRRALVRDQLAHTARVAGEAIDTTSRDLSHRAYGLMAESSHLFRRDEVSDEVLMARVRSRLGRAVSHPHAIEVKVKDGRVTLGGQVLAHELNRLLSGVSSVRGVEEVENQLTVHAQAAGVPALQGGRPRTGGRIALMQTNWSPATRLLAGVAGGALMAYCLKRRDAVSAAIGTLGFGLFARGVTNLELKSLVGVGRDCRAVEVQKTINIQAPIERVFDFWTNYQNFPRLMSNVREARPSGNNRSHWIVAGPAGVPVEWTAEITELARNKFLAWRTVPGSAINHTGEIRFEPNHGGGTRIHIRVCYHPLGGAVGHTLARIFGADPKSEMDADLVRMKTLVETGHHPHDAASPLPAGSEIPLTRTSAV